MNGMISAKCGLRLQDIIQSIAQSAAEKLMSTKGAKKDYEYI
jgi:hypothetical protein